MSIARKATGMASHYGTQLKVLARAGIIRPYSPVVLYRMGRTLLDWGPGLAGGFTTLALRAPDEVGLVDELGELTFGELHERTTGSPTPCASTGSVRATASRSCATTAASSRPGRRAKIGADLLYLNTAFATRSSPTCSSARSRRSSCTTRSSPTSSRPVTTPSGSWPGPTPTTSTARSSSG